MITVRCKDREHASRLAELPRELAECGDRPLRLVVAEDVSWQRVVDVLAGLGDTARISGLGRPGVARFGHEEAVYVAVEPGSGVEQAGVAARGGGARRSSGRATIVQGDADDSDKGDDVLAGAFASRSRVIGRGEHASSAASTAVRVVNVIATATPRRWRRVGSRWRAHHARASARAFGRRPRRQHVYPDAGALQVLRPGPRDDTGR